MNLFAERSRGGCELDNAWKFYPAERHSRSTQQQCCPHASKTLLISQINRTPFASQSNKNKLIKDTSRLTPPINFLIPGLCLGPHCSEGSASLRNASETRMHDSAGRACKSVGSKAEPAEPRNQWVTINSVLKPLRLEW